MVIPIVRRRSIYSLQSIDGNIIIDNAYVETDIYIDLIIRLGSFWIGIHHSKRNQSWCIALIPCIVIRIGKTIYKEDK